MTTLTPAGVNLFPNDALEKKVYAAAETLSDILPVQNDRYRLGYNLFKHFTHDGDTIEVIVRSNRFSRNGVTKEELVERIKEAIKDIK